MKKTSLCVLLAASLTYLAFPAADVFAALPKSITFTNFFGSAVSFQNPLFFTEMPGKPGYYVVLEQYVGQVNVVHKVNGTWVKTVMDTVTLGDGVTSQNEMGLLGIAFHPDYATTRKYYLTYNPTTTATWLVARQADTSLIRRDANIASVHLLTINKPYTNHNGGTIAFSPKDTASYLYLGTGDGGSGGDPDNRAQNTDSLQGKFLRIDVDHSANGKPYGIPADNPFVGNAAYAPEIYSLGERNPWKWSFDTTGMIWLGHVGQDLWEAASIVPKGSNLGWHVVEGGHCFNPATGCSMVGYQLPFTSYAHSATTGMTGNCVIGGYVYRGNPASPFFGAYFMGDNGSGQVWAVQTDGISVQDSVLEGTVSNLTSFGTDLAGNLYALSRGGIIYAMGGPDLQPVPILPGRKSGLAPQSLFGLNRSNLVLHDLTGKRVIGTKGNGVYIVNENGSEPALVPVLK